VPFAVDKEELSPVSCGPERFPFDVGGLAGAAGAHDQPRTALHQPRHHDQTLLVGPAEVPVDLDAKGDRAEVVVPHLSGSAHGRLHPPGGFALLALDLGRVDGLPPARQVQGGGQEADRDGQGELGPQKCSRRRVVELGGADLP
jgi:hypothetical protein